MEPVFIERYIELVENGLEGTWSLDSPIPQFISFSKPSEIGGRGKLVISANADLSKPQTIEYEILFVDNPNPIGHDFVYMNIYVKTSNQKIQYQLLIKYLASYVGKMQIIDSNGRSLYYDKVETQKEVLQQ